MINWLHARLHRPGTGWDPVPLDHACTYAEGAWRELDEQPLDRIESWLGGFAGKEVLDLGGGPGQFSCAMARRGAQVTWHDVSQNYLNIVKQKGAGLPIRYSLGYLEEAQALGDARFDLVFNRICWYYSRSDRGFARLIWKLLRPGGVGYVDASNSTFRVGALSMSARIRTGLNSVCYWKIGHPHPPHGRIANLLMRLPIDRMLIDYSEPSNDRLLFVKSVL